MWHVAAWFVLVRQSWYGLFRHGGFRNGKAVLACMGGAAFVWAVLGMAVKERRG